VVGDKEEGAVPTPIGAVKMRPLSLKKRRG
jgi:hypothetical protein